VALRSIQLLTEISTTNISWGKSGQCLGLITFPHSCADGLETFEPQTTGTLGACTGVALPLHVSIFAKNKILSLYGKAAVFT
jgi:hypothetical protein